MLLDRMPRTIEDYLNLHEGRLNKLERDPGPDDGTFSSITTYAQDDEPTGEQTVGSLWIDTDDDNKIYRWDGLTWVLIRDSGLSQDQASLALLLISLQDAASTADNKVTTYYRSTVPTGTSFPEGDLWVNSTTNTLYRWSGGGWVPQTADGTLGTLLIAETNTLSVADGRIVTYWQFGAPAASGIGDLWVDTENDNKVYRWSGSRWVSLLEIGVEQVLALAESKSTVFLAPAQTVPTATAVNDLWLVDPTHEIRQWDGTAWVSRPLHDDAIADMAVTKLRAGSLAVLVELALGGELIAGDRSGAHVVLDQAGLHAYSDAATQTVNVGSDGSARLAGAVQSTDYDQGTAGWAFSSEDAQVNNLQVLGELGATTLSSDDITIGGISFATNFGPSVSRGVVTFVSLGDSARDNSVDVGDTETGLVEINVGDLDTSRAYVASYAFTLSSIGAVTDTSFTSRVRYTSDGTRPGITSPLLPGAGTRFQQTTGALASVSRDVPFTLPSSADTQQRRFLVTLQRSAGTGSGTGRVVFVDPTNPFLFWITDGGVVAGETSDAAQRAKLSGAADDPDPTADFSRRWFAQWGGSYDGNTLNQRSGALTSNLYQGVNPTPDGHGNTRAVIGFNSTDIQARLAGATIIQAQLTCTVRHSGANSGVLLQIGTHSYTNTSPPPTWVGASTTPSRFTRRATGGSTFTVNVPTGVIADLQSGAARGLTLGPGASTAGSNYGYLYGAGTGRAPYLTVSYSA